VATTRKAPARRAATPRRQPGRVPSRTPERVVIATRGSALALWQANWVRDGIRAAFPGTEVDLNIIKTTGDKMLAGPLAAIGGKGLFVKEIEEALLKGEADLAVHSMKDVPADLPEGLEMAAVTEREDPRDAFLSVRFADLDRLPRGATVGSSSLRRQAQLLAYRPDLRIELLRGNVDTRIKRLKEGKYDAILLAAAGVRRLGLTEHVRQYLGTDLCLPAIGQGALGLEARRGDARMRPVLARFHHPATAAPVAAERAFMARVEGGCQVPIAAHGRIVRGTLHVSGLVAAVDGSRVIRRAVSGPPARAEALGKALADAVLAAGGRAILARLRAEAGG
jgi:hydroxymethylbilane synthase